MIEEWAESPFTLHDAKGEPFATRLPDGSYLQKAADHRTCRAWDAHTASFQEWDVVWHGGRKRGDWSQTKGELLGDYARLAEVFRWMGISGPIAKIPSATWYRMGKGLSSETPTLGIRKQEEREAWRNISS